MPRPHRRNLRRYSVSLSQLLRHTFDLLSARVRLIKILRQIRDRRSKGE